MTTMPFPFPNFFLIGAPRSGSTSLFHYLGQHPDIFLSRIKEPNYFGLAHRHLDPNAPGVRQLLRVSVLQTERYRALFDQAVEESAVGEMSVGYLHMPGVPEAIYAEAPLSRLIVILRNPIERAYADFMGYRREGLEPHLEFSAALRDVQKRKREGWAYGTYLEEGFYYRHLSRFLQHFDCDQIFVCLFDDLQKDASELVHKIFDFLGVDPSFPTSTTVQYNPTGELRRPWARALWRASGPARQFLRPFLPETIRNRAIPILGGVEKKPLEPETHDMLLEIYRSDILALQGLLGRDLGHWLKASEA